MRPSFNFNRSKLSCRAGGNFCDAGEKTLCGSAKFRLANSRTSPACQPSNTSRGIFHISRYLSLKSVTLLSSSVTRIASVVDSNVARMIARASASSLVRCSRASFARRISCSARWRIWRMLVAVCRAEDRSSSVSSSDSTLFAIDHFLRQQCSLHPRANLRKRLFARGRSVVTEW